MNTSENEPQQPAPNSWRSDTQQGSSASSVTKQPEPSRSASTSPPVLVAALAYLQRGWSVIPLRDKKPLLSSWKEFQSRRPSELEVQAWFGQSPGAAVGVVCGKISGLAVLDIDDVPLAERLISSGVGTGTTTVRTPSGGLHIYLRETQAQSRSRPLVPGVADLKAGGGYVVAPPSTSYVFLSSNPPMEVADAQTWAIDILKANGVRIDAEKADQSRRMEGPVNPGARNDKLFRSGMHMWSEGSSASAVKDQLLTANARWCKPPLAILEIEAILRSITSYPQRSTAPRPLKGNGGVEFTPVSLGELAEPSERRSLVAGLIPAGYASILYGDGGQGKSYVALALASCVAWGKPFLELEVSSGGVLYLDWELDREEMARRAYKVARGLGVERPPRNLWYERVTQPFSTLLEKIRAYINEHGVKLIVIDSLGAACGEDPELAKFVIPLFTMLRSLDTTFLVIDHQSKMHQGQDYDRKTPFGSVYKFNLSRSVIQLQRVGGKAGQLDLVLRHTKFNFGALREPLGMRLLFEGNAVRLLHVDTHTDPSFYEQLNAEEKVLRSLREDGPGSRKVLAERTALPEGTVGNTLTKLKKEGKTDIVEKEKGVPIWGVISPPPQGADSNGSQMGAPPTILPLQNPLNDPGVSL